VPVSPQFVSRGGVKLRHALSELGVDPSGLLCADLGCSTGGFTDCLLRAGASRVVSVDTGYGVLAWRLRNDPRVTVRERENALYAPPVPGGVDLVVIDLGWTPQRLCIPVALTWLRPAVPACRVLTLIKPHYEKPHLEVAGLGGGGERGGSKGRGGTGEGDGAARAKRVGRGGVLPDAEAEAVAQRVIEAMPDLGAKVLGSVQSPIRGSGGKREGEGNLEWFALLEPARRGEGPARA
jgi:23S rRNA (cytidine1920-2'-O)/16S rRNA (cytidine1409-2'-O)-methyltransferase